MNLHCAYVNKNFWMRIAACILTIAIMQCGEPCIAQPNSIQIHIDPARSIRPNYREALLDLRATSSDPLDSSALQKFKVLLAKNGWPTVQSAGEDGVNAAAILVLRSTIDFPFQEQVENLVWGERIYIDVNASAAANWIDDIEYRHDRKQIFGTLLSLRNGKVIERAPLDKSYANFMRDFNGLPLLQNYIFEIQQRVDRGESLSQANLFPNFAKKFTPYTDPGLREELNAMSSKEQSVRVACTDAKVKFNSDACKQIKQIKSVDDNNLPKVEDIFRKYGFPTSNMVGRDGVNSFFLLVQHAVSDHKFQVSVLTAAMPRLASGDLAHQDYALLDDRVRLALGKKQLYGTQINLENNGRAELLPISNPGSLDERRYEMAMDPEKVYFIEICKTYHPDKSEHKNSCKSQLDDQLLHMQMNASSSNASS